MGMFGRHEMLYSGLALLAVIVAFGFFLDAKSDLEQARDSARQSRDALLQGDAAAASNRARDAHSQAHSARDATHSLPWNVASAVPWLGSTFKAGQQITDVVLGLATDVLEHFADIGTAISPDRLLQGGHLDLQLLRSEEPALSRIAADATQLDADAKAISDPTFLAVLRDARSDLQKQTSDAAELLRNTALAARIAPPLMDADGPRTYFMGFQTNAEAPGASSAASEFCDSTTVFRRSTRWRRTPSWTKPLRQSISAPNTPNSMNSRTPASISDSNMSTHFPYAAQIWKSMWAQQTGMVVDGVIAIDPVALSYVLGATGPVTMPDGEVVTSDNVVELTESTAYVRFPTDQPARKQYLQDVAKEVVTKITGTVRSPRDLLDVLGKAVGEGRLAVSSSSLTDQTLLEETSLAHVIPDDPAPYAAVVMNNLGGNKLDYYLTPGIEYAADGCDGERRNATVTVRLTNTAPGGLPDYVAGSAGLTPDAPINVPNGTMLTSVRLIATDGAVLKGALANGQRVPVFRGKEIGHPTFEVQVAVPPTMVRTAAANADVVMLEELTPEAVRRLSRAGMDQTFPYRPEHPRRHSNSNRRRSSNHRRRLQLHHRHEPVPPTAHQWLPRRRRAGGLWPRPDVSGESQVPTTHRHRPRPHQERHRDIDLNGRDCRHRSPCPIEHGDGPEGIVG